MHDLPTTTDGWAGAAWTTVVLLTTCGCWGWGDPYPCCGDPYFICCWLNPSCEWSWGFTVYSGGSVPTVTEVLLNSFVCVQLYLCLCTYKKYWWVVCVNIKRSVRRNRLKPVYSAALLNSGSANSDRWLWSLVMDWVNDFQGQAGSGSGRKFRDGSGRVRDARIVN